MSDGKIDSDGDGVITMPEVKGSIASRGIQHTLEMIQQSNARLSKEVKDALSSGSKGPLGELAEAPGEIWDKGKEISGKAKNLLPKSLQILAGIGVAGATFLVDFVEDPVGTIRDAVETIIFDSVLKPVGESLWGAGVAFLDALLIIIYGGDRAIGIQDGTFIGLLDIPVLLVDPFVALANLTRDVVVVAIGSVNDAIASGFAAELGIAAPPVVSFLWAVEIAGGAWLAWTAINSIDIPAVRVVGMAKVATKPLRNAFRWFT